MNDLLDLLAGASPDAARWKEITADLLRQFQSKWNDNQPWDAEQGLCFWCYERAAWGEHDPNCAWLRASKALGWL